MKYRAEIDGLRALAVIPVILFHAGFELFNGGFVGVDVFFVISGYLITTILIEDLDNKRFSITHFYERRARRILPALFFVMLVCLPLAWMWMLPSQMKDFSQSLIAVSLFVSNIQFWRETNYFAAAAEENPLLHTWSLAVEEQFYLFFPIFLFIAWRFGKSRVFWIISFISLISLMLSEWGWRNAPTANFYLAPTRVWELFAGSIIAFLVQKKGAQKNDILALLGLTLIIFSIFAFDNNTPFPGLYALLPVLGTSLLILYATKGSLTAKLLSLKVFVGVGLISYSAYLWHQPLFAFARLRMIDHPPSYVMLALCTISIALAYISWKYVEKPFRDRRIFKKKFIFSFSIIGICFFMAVGFAGHLSQGIPSRFSDEVLTLDKFKSKQQIVRDESCTSITGFNKRERCILGSRDNIRGVLLGDSHAHMLWETLNSEFLKKGIGFLSFTSGGCPPILEAWRRDRKNDCNLVNQSVFNYVKSNKEIEFVILSGRWTLHIERTRFNNLEGNIESGNEAILDVINDGVKEKNSELERQNKLLAKLEDSIMKFDSLNRKIFVVYPVPEVGFSPAIKLAKEKIFNQNTTNQLTHSYQVFLDRNSKVRGLFNELEKKTSWTTYYDISNELCDSQTLRCRTFSEKKEPYYYDDDHLSSFGAEFISNEIKNWINYQHL